MEQPTPAVLRISDPADLAQIVPYLIGFIPEDSLVVIATQNGRIQVTARIDLTEVQPPGAAENLLDRIWARFPDAEAYTIAYTHDPEAAWPILNRCEAHLPHGSLTMVIDGDHWQLRDGTAGTIMPGYTHLQVAQPVTFGHHLLAYEAMFARDAERLSDCRRRVNRLPLGSAALAGTSFPIDRERVARELGFEGLCANSLDAVSDRDFAIEFAAAAALAMTHVSRIAEELAWWTNPRLGFVTLADRFCTGSSIMPQKKNPDVAELARGKTGRMNGHLVALLTLMKGQPLAYNRDNQEDKEPLFDAVDTLADTLAIMADLVAGGLTVNAARMREAAAEGHATATDLADYLVRKGVPFRDAHEAVARAVRHAEARGCDIASLPLAELQSFAPSIGEDVFAVLTLEGSVASRDHPGGTAPARVLAAAAAARAALAAEAAARPAGIAEVPPGIGA